MPSSIGTSGGNKTIAAIFVGTASGNKAVQTGFVGTSGGNKVFFSTFTAGMSPGDQSDVGSSISHIFLAETTTPVGGVGPFTHAWSYTATSGGTWNVSSPSNATTTPSVSGVGSGITVTATLQDLVTDTATGLTYPVTANLSYERT